LAVPSVAILGLVPLVAYFLVRPHVGSDTVALGIVWLIPVVKTLVSSLARAPMATPIENSVAGLLRRAPASVESMPVRCLSARRPSSCRGADARPR
jgi:hypothetical protein